MRSQTCSACSTNFPTKNPKQANNGGQADVFVVKLDSTKATTAQLLYSTYLGGSSFDKGLAIALDSSGTAYVTGYSQSTGFPTQNAWQPSNAGDKDAILVAINPALSGAASLLPTFGGGTCGLYTYDVLGNITFKIGVGTYGYSATHPHAVTAAGPFGFGDDAIK